MRNIWLILFIFLIAGTAEGDEFPYLGNLSNGSDVCPANTSDGSCDTDADTSNITDADAGQTCKTYNVGKCDDEIYALYFYKTDCPHCEKVKPLIEELELKYNLNLTKINAGEDPTLCIHCAACYNISEDDVRVPMVIISNYALVSDKEIEDKFEGIIKTCRAEGCACVTVPGDDVHVPEPPTLGALLIAMIIGAAIADALNVCALGILIFLIASVLSKTRRDHKGALKVGLSFIAGIYLMYFLTGVGMFHVLKEFIVGTGTVGLFKKIIGFFALIIGVLNLKDYLSYGSLGFTMEVPKSWDNRVTKIIGGVTSVRGAFAAGIVISFFLAPCVITIYASIVGMMSTMNIPFLLAVVILALYNLAFVLPMLIVVFMVYFGVKRTGGMEMWRQRNKRRMHLLTGIVMVILGIVLIIGAL